MSTPLSFQDIILRLLDYWKDQGCLVQQGSDRFPVVFAAVTMATMALGRATGRAGLVAAGVGAAGYGLLYLLVHDVGVHGRLNGGRGRQWERTIVVPDRPAGDGTGERKSGARGRHRYQLMR